MRAAFLQNGGIGRGMKVGKEGMAGTIAALEAWAQRDHAGDARARDRLLCICGSERLSPLAGRHARTIVPDPTDNPLDRLEVHVDPAEARITAWDLADALAAGDPPVIVRDHEVELGFFFLDPCNLHPGRGDRSSPTGSTRNWSAPAALNARSSALATALPGAAGRRRRRRSNGCCAGPTEAADRRERMTEQPNARRTC